MEYFHHTDTDYTAPFSEVNNVTPYADQDIGGYHGYDSYQSTDILPTDDRYPDAPDTPLESATLVLFDELNDAGVTLEPLTLDDVAAVNNRDFAGDYPYVSVLPEKYGDSLDTLGIIVDGHVVAYGIAGMFADQDEQLGEIGMIHVSAEARDFGLGGLVTTVMHKRLLAQSPDGLHAVIGDSTGRMRTLFARAGYEDFGHTDSAEADPVMRRYFASDLERTTFAGEIDEAVHTQATRLNGRTDALLMTAVGDARDNPGKLDIPAVVASRVDGQDTLNGTGAVTLFGQIGAPVRIARSAPYEDNGCSIMLDVSSPNPVRVAEQLQGRDSESYVSVLPPIRGTSTVTRLATLPLRSADRIRDKAIRFAKIAQRTKIV